MLFFFFQKVKKIHLVFGIQDTFSDGCSVAPESRRFPCCSLNQMRSFSANTLGWVRSDSPPLPSAMRRTCRRSRMVRRRVVPSLGAKHSRFYCLSSCSDEAKVWKQGEMTLDRVFMFFCCFVFYLRKTEQAHLSFQLYREH